MIHGIEPYLLNAKTEYELSRYFLKKFKDEVKDEVKSKGSSNRNGDSRGPNPNSIYTRGMLQ